MLRRSFVVLVVVGLGCNTGFGEAPDGGASDADQAVLGIGRASPEGAPPHDDASVRDATPPEASASGDDSPPMATGGEEAGDATREDASSFDATIGDAGLDGSTADAAVEADATDEDDAGDAEAGQGPSECEAAPCLVTLAAGIHPASLAIAGNNAYFGDPAAGTIVRLPLDGGASVAIATGQSQWQAPGTNAGQVFVAGDRVFWADSTYVATVGEDGGASEVTPVTSSLQGFTLDGDGGTVFWESSDGLFRTSVSTGETSQLATVSGQAPPVFDGTRVVLFSGPACDESATAFSLDGGVNTLSSGISGNVYTASQGGGAVAFARQTYGSCVCAPSCPAPFSSADQWADGLGAFSLGSPGADAVVSPYPLGVGVSVGAIATDGRSVYVGSLGAISRVPLDGGPAVTLTAAQAPVTLVLDATSLYWVDANAGTLVKLYPR